MSHVVDGNTATLVNCRSTVVVLYLKSCIHFTTMLHNVEHFIQLNDIGGSTKTLTQTQIVW